MLLVILMLLVVGCNSTPKEAEETEVKTTVNVVGTEDDVEINIEASVPALDEWCLAGSTYDVTSTDGSVSTIIEGIETYKGSKFCKGVQTTNIEGVGEVQTTYYFNEDAEEMWVISTISGQTTEIHIVDGAGVAVQNDIGAGYGKRPGIIGSARCKRHGIADSPKSGLPLRTGVAHIPEASIR